MVIARWPRPSSAPAPVRPAAIASATAVLVEPRAGPHPVGRREVDHQHPYRTVGLGLQDEAALELQRGAEQHAEHDGLAEQFRDRLGIVVAGQDRVDRGAEPNHAPAQIERRNLEGLNGVVGRNLRWCAARYRNIRLGHSPYLEARTEIASVLLRHDLVRKPVPTFRDHAGFGSFNALPGTRPECPSARAGGSPPHRKPPTAARR